MFGHACNCNAVWSSILPKPPCPVHAPRPITVVIETNPIVIREHCPCCGKVHEYHRDDLRMTL